MFFTRTTGIFILILICTVFSIKSQSILQGRVLSSVDSTAIYGASVYFDGTSIGVSTDDDGRFQIPLRDGTTSALVISSIGFETRLIPNHSSFAGRSAVIYMQESRDRLDEVHLETDPWTRKKKLDIFRREFLGRSKAALKCRILNEEALVLRYIPSKELLVATASEPLVILNRHLGYELKYNLNDFQVRFSTGSSGLQLVHIVYYEGSSFFKNLKEPPRKRHLQRREKAYTGSFVHFLRSLATSSLTENNFSIYHGKFEVPPYEYFDLQQVNGLVQVKLLADKLSILHNKFDQSSLEATGAFSIDPYGNHTPPQNILFGGLMGEGRIAAMLPLDYFPAGKN